MRAVLWKKWNVSDQGNLFIFLPLSVCVVIKEIDPKAGGGHLMTIGNVVRQLLTKLDWYDTLFPRIPVPIQVRW